MTVGRRGDVCSIDVPGDPVYLSTVRLFASAVARHFGASEETAGDLKVAVSEASSAFLRGAGEGTIKVAIEANEEFHVEVVSDELSLVVPPSPSSGIDTPAPGSAAAELGLELIRTLYPDAQIVSDGTSAIRFTVPIRD